MKKKIWIPIAIIVFLTILFVPIPKSPCRDGGTKEYTALTYKIIDWNRYVVDTIYDKTKTYFFPNNFKTIDELWESEKNNVEYSFKATVLEIYDSSVLVQPVDCSDMLSVRDKITFGTKDLENIKVEVGSIVEITYSGEIMESYPLQINAKSWKMADDVRCVSYTQQWLDKSTAKKCENDYTAPTICLVLSLKNESIAFSTVLFKDSPV